MIQRGFSIVSFFQDLKLSLTSTTPPPKIGDSYSVFTKPTPPDDVKRKNPRVYSYSPISRTRLTVPKRQFSPEPVRKTAKSSYYNLISNHILATISIDLIDFR